MVKNSLVNAGDAGLIPGWERSPGEGNDNALKYSCLGNPMDREAWRATVHGIVRVRHNIATKNNKSRRHFHWPLKSLLRSDSKELIEKTQLTYFP